VRIDSFGGLLVAVWDANAVKDPARGRRCGVDMDCLRAVVRGQAGSIAHPHDSIENTSVDRHGGCVVRLQSDSMERQKIGATTAVAAYA
jgi:hypothetical protein